jgi:ornithine cyclodeaminase/alanine dehydrogenase-like protein (mu-crystallin family)
VSELTYLSGRDVAAACAEIDPVAVVAETLALHTSEASAEADVGWEVGAGEPARLLVMPGLVDGVAGVKVLGANLGNPARGLARAAGLTILVDRTTARPICVMEGARISALRTAAVTALAVRLLAGPPVQRMAVIGAGALAAAHLDLLPPRLPALAEVRLHDLRPGRAQTLGMTLERRRAVRVRLAPTAERAIRGAELVVAVTTATAGYIELGWLAPGALVVNVSLDDVLPEVVLGAERVVVDDWRAVQADRRRLLGRMGRDGLVTGPGVDGGPVHAELGELLRGRRQGRRDERERILVNPFGLAIEDVAMASRVYAAARGLGLGVALEP